MDVDVRIRRAAFNAASHPIAKKLNSPPIVVDPEDYEDYNRADVTDWQLGRCDVLAGCVVLDDDEVAKGFEGDPLHEVFGETPMVRLETHGSALNGREMFSTALAAAVQRIFLEREQITADRIAAELRAGIQALRSAIESGKTIGTLVCGLDRVTVRSSISTPWGTVMPTRSDDPHVLERPRCTAIWRRDRPVSVRIGSGDEAAADRQFSYPVDDEDLRVFQLLRLAFVLAEDDFGKMEAPNAIWYREMLPFATFGTMRRGFVEPYHFDRLIESAPVAEWAALIGDGRSGAVRLASKRLPLATTRDVEDALIDAVVVWEALFGAKTETTFRVTSALARLLEPDPTKRQRLASDLRKTYGVRSRIVHGGEPGNADLYEHRKQAVVVAVDALRASLVRGDEWMKLTSERRSDHILLE